MKIELRKNNEQVITLWEQDDIGELQLALALAVIKAAYVLMIEAEGHYGSLLTLWIDEDKEVVYEQINCVKGLADFMRGD